ncbi:MAG: 50S ribosomal protein L10 [Candidatus Omnitrophica bacterium]|nr:50S ribosomal protein L10 [Candidatus Omnitrophota bacterium]
MARIGRLVKESIANELRTELKQRPNFFVTSITRMPAAEANVFRQKLHATNARLLMINRRMGRKALEPLSLEGLHELLKGSVGLVLAGDDALPALKVLVDFRKTHEQQLIVSGGILDGELLLDKQLSELAALPSRPVLLAHVLGTIEAPIADVIVTIERLIGDLAWLAEQAAESKTASPIPPASELTKEGT